MQELFRQHSDELRQALSNLDEFYTQCEKVGEVLRDAWKAGAHVYIAGNGGSASQAQHWAGEMVGRYKSNRKPYPMVSLTADTAALTCIGNDFGYENVYARQVEALGKEGDVFIGMSTSGTSANIVLAASQARKLGMTVIALTANKGDLKDMADYSVLSPAESTARIQELHIHAIHLICEMFEPEHE